MPAPFTIVTFVDDDGDEFPVSVYGRFDTPTLLSKAEFDAMALVKSGGFTPNGPLVFKKMEFRGQEVAATQEP